MSLSICTAATAWHCVYLSLGRAAVKLFVVLQFWFERLWQTLRSDNYLVGGLNDHSMNSVTTVYLIHPRVPCLLYVATQVNMHQRSIWDWWCNQISLPFPSMYNSVYRTVHVWLLLVCKLRYKHRLMYSVVWQSLHAAVLTVNTCSSLTAIRHNKHNIHVSLTTNICTSTQR